MMRFRGSIAAVVLLSALPFVVWLRVTGVEISPVSVIFLLAQLLLAAVVLPSALAFVMRCRVTGM
jgi:hypothetical protein